MAETQKRPALTLEQRIAQQQARLAKLQAQKANRSRKLATREKIIIGGAIVAEAADNPDFQEQVAGVLKKRVTRDADLEVIAVWLSHTL